MFTVLLFSNKYLNSWAQLRKERGGGGGREGSLICSRQRTGTSSLPTTTVPSAELWSGCCPSARLRMFLHCPSASAGGNGRMGQQPGAALAAAHERERGCQAQPQGPAPLPCAAGAALAGGQGGLPCPQLSSPPSGRVSGQSHKPEHWELRFPPSTATPELLLCHPAVRQEGEECGNLLRARSSGIYVVCILTRVATPPCFLNYTTWI